MRDLGYVEGRNISYEARWAHGQLDTLPGLAAELVALRVDVIVASFDPVIEAAKRATSTIPIVMTFASSPTSATICQPGAARGQHHRTKSLLREPRCAANASPC